MLHELSMYWREGGWGMWPILPCLLATLSIAVGRVRYHLREGVDEDALLGVVAALVREGRVAEAVTWSLRAPTALGRMLVEGIARLDGDDAEVLGAMECVALRERPRIEGRVDHLVPAGQIAALLGLLGTITGMVMPFGCVGGHGGGPTVDPARRAELIAGCLSEAIHCTHFGLAVAVVSVAASLALRGPTRRRLAAFDRAAALVVLLAQERRAVLPSRHPYR
ncbi:MAG: MotA/TolQ/ExbB proton channel family protein [Polyangiales bacterium]